MESFCNVSIGGIILLKNMLAIGRCVNLSDRMHKVFILYSGLFDIIISLNQVNHFIVQKAG